MDAACAIHIDDACDTFELIKAMFGEMRQKLFEGHFAFATHDDICTMLQIFSRIIGRIWPAKNHGRIDDFAQANHLQDAALGHHVGIETDDRWLMLLQKGLEGKQIAKGRIKHADVEALLLEIGTDIEQTQRRIRLHYLAFVWVFVQEIAVCEQNIHQVSWAIGSSGVGSGGSAAIWSRERRALESVSVGEIIEAGARTGEGRICGGRRTR